MAAFYLDEGVSRDVSTRLRLLGHQVDTTDELQRRGSTDDVQLLTAARLSSVLVVHDKADFVLLHGAWLNWSTAWQTSAQHLGILIVPQTWSSVRIAEEIDRHVTRHPVLTNQLWQWEPRSGGTDRS